MHKKTLRFYFRFVTALLRKHYLAIALGFLVAFLAINYSKAISRFIFQSTSTDTIAIIGRYTLSDLPEPIQRKISLGLTTLDPSGIASAGIASSWEATDSGRTYTFTINTNLSWQDGKSLQSQDIRYNFEDAKIEYPDESHLVIRLSDPFAPLPSVLSRPVFRFEKRIGFLSSPKYLGLGSYEIKSYRRNGPYLTSLTLAPVKSHWQLPKLTYLFYPSPDAARTALKLGLVNQIEGLTVLDELFDWPNLLITSSVQFDRHVAVFFNTQNEQLAGSSGRNLRLALAYAIDKSRWSNRSYGPIPTYSWVFNPDAKKYEYDSVKAQENFKKVEKAPELTISTVPAYLAVAEAVKSDWAKLGLTVHISVSPDIPESFQTLIIAQAIPPDPDQYNLWHSTKQETNLTQLKNPRIDKLLEDGRKVIDPDTRKTIYLDFQKFLLEEVPAVFLFYPETYTVSRL